MYGAALARGPQGAVGAGLGQTISTGTVSLIAPTDIVTTTGQEEVVDGVRMVFQMAPDTEAPSEMLIYLPDLKALCAAEDATHNLHNLLTLRGAVVRDPHGWSKYLTETIDLFGDEVEVVFASHHWPTWGNERVVEFLSLQRDLYAYLHDQTLRMLNKGLVGPEIAEEITLPPALENAWSTRGYYGSVSHNVKAIYQRYLGWFDGNPAHLWEHPPVEQAKRYVDLARRRRRRRRRTPGGVRRRRLPLGRGGGSTTWSSPSPTTRRRASCSPTPTSSSATAPRTAPGATSTSPAPPSCATASSAPRPRPPHPT